MRTGGWLFSAALAGAVLLGFAPAAPCQFVDHRAVGPFDCWAEYPLTEIEELVAQLAQLQVDLQRGLGVPATSESIELLLFASERSYRDFLQKNYPNIPYRRALYVKDGGPGRVMAFRSPEFDVDVRHECTHALLHGALPMVPLWLDEGLAEYFEAPPDRRAWNGQHLRSVRWGAKLGLRPKLTDLEQKGDISEMNSSAYRGAWAWVHFMLHSSPETHDELVRYLADIRALNPPGQLSQRLRLRIGDADKRFLEHFRSWKE